MNKLSSLSGSRPSSISGSQSKSRISHLSAGSTTDTSGFLPINNQSHPLSSKSFTNTFTTAIHNQDKKEQIQKFNRDSKKSLSEFTSVTGITPSPSHLPRSNRKQKSRTRTNSGNHSTTKGSTQYLSISNNTGKSPLQITTFSSTIEDFQTPMIHTNPHDNTVSFGNLKSNSTSLNPVSSYQTSHTNSTTSNTFTSTFSAKNTSLSVTSMKESNTNASSYNKPHQTRTFNTGSHDDFDPFHSNDNETDPLSNRTRSSSGYKEDKENLKFTLANTNKSHTGISFATSPKSLDTDNTTHTSDIRALDDRYRISVRRSTGPTSTSGLDQANSDDDRIEYHKTNLMTLSKNQDQLSLSSASIASLSSSSVTKSYQNQITPKPFLGRSKTDVTAGLNKSRNNSRNVNLTQLDERNTYSSDGSSPARRRSRSFFKKPRTPDDEGNLRNF